jgi:DNA recombination protein Rad52
MTGFSPHQLKNLERRLDPARIQSREIEGRKIDYIEGRFAIAEANHIFGYGGWDREMAHFERVLERSSVRGTEAGYLARVRIRVRAGRYVIVREGTGFGHAWAALRADAHERAIKAAETDATKRALATFGNRFGLSLYDKDHATRVAEAGERIVPDDGRWSVLKGGRHWELRTADGAGGPRLGAFGGGLLLRSPAIGRSRTRGGRDRRPAKAQWRQPCRPSRAGAQAYHQPWRPLCRGADSTPCQT